MDGKGRFWSVMTGLALMLLTGAWAPESSAKEKVHVKHIILFIGDGMHLEREIAASRYLFGKDQRLVFHGFPYRGNVATWDVNT